MELRFPSPSVFKMEMLLYVYIVCLPEILNQYTPTTVCESVHFHELWPTVVIVFANVIAENRLIL